MTIRLPFLLLCFAVSYGLAQTAEPPSPEPEQEQTAREQQTAQATPAKERENAPEQQNEASRTNEAAKSTLDVKPGKPAIKTKELIENKPISPWANFPRHLLSDEKSIWTSPFRTKARDAKWWALFGGATGVLISTDKFLSRQLPNTKDQVKVANVTSKLGAAYTLVPATAGVYFVGTFTHNDRLRETGILGVESLINTYIVVSVLKSVTQRERPDEGDGKGRFWQGNGRFWNSGASFPSGHAIHTWALASILAHEYPRPRIVPILGYAFASTVVGSRFAARRHFASDVVAGAALGWFIGDFVYGKRHNRALDGQPRAAWRKMLSHVQIGGL